MTDYLLCVVGQGHITHAFIHELREVFDRHDITLTKNEDDMEPSHEVLHFEFTTTELDETKLKFDILSLSDSHKVDISLMTKEAFLHPKKLVVFDMDSTLIQHEVIDEMAILHGVGAKVSSITERAMNGELNFNQSLSERVSLLKGFSKKQMEELTHSLKLTPGAEKLISTLKAQGYKTAIISGGFKHFGEHFRKKLGMDYAFCNDLAWENDLLTGTISGEVVNAEKKAELMEMIAQKENLSLKDVVAVGDGANDLLMLAKAGLGIAFHAKPKVKQAAKFHVSHGPMTTILYFLGIPGKHLP